MVEYNNTSLKNAIPVPLFQTIKHAIEKNGDGITEYLHYPYLEKCQPDFAIRMYDNSLKSCSINKGDIVFIRRTTYLEEKSQIVCVLLKKPTHHLVIKKIGVDKSTGKIVLYSNGKNRRFLCIAS